MRVTLFHKKLLAGIACVVMLAALPVPAAFCQTGGEGDASYHNQRGMEFFKKGFYEHTPKKQLADAEKNYGQAIEAFHAAITKDPHLVDPHKNLARVYYVQKNFEGAAQEYQKVTELVPGDVDSYVTLALSLIKLERFDEAIVALESAKQQTSDEKALKTLDTYIAKVEAHREKGVK